MTLDSDIQKRFGEKLRKLRRNANLSQEEFADQCDLDRTYIGGIVRGERNVSLKNIQVIATALGMSISDLMEGI